MIKLLADANIRGQVFRLARRMQLEPWIGFWNHLDLRLLQFHEVGLDLADSDATVWRCCQDQQLILLTDNRNDDGPNSLESTIRIQGESDSLPVFTIADSRRVLRDPNYADQIIDRLLRYLLELDAVRGAGRLYLP